MTLDELKKLLLALDPIVHAEGETRYDYGYGGETYAAPDARTESLREVLGRHGGDWDRAASVCPEITRILEDWPRLLGHAVVDAPPPPVRLTWLQADELVEVLSQTISADSARAALRARGIEVVDL